MKINIEKFKELEDSYKENWETMQVITKMIDVVLNEKESISNGIISSNYLISLETLKELGIINI